MKEYEGGEKIRYVEGGQVYSLYSRTDKANDICHNASCCVMCKGGGRSNYLDQSLPFIFEFPWDLEFFCVLRGRLGAGRCTKMGRLTETIGRQF